MSEQRIKVFIKKPGENPREFHIVNSLETLQKIVGGYIETFTFATDMVIVCNEEGRLRGLPPNCNVCGADFVGTIIFAGRQDDEFTDIPVDEDVFKLVFGNLYEE